MGFSSYLEKYNLLFDTGSNGRVLLQNIKALNIDINEIKYLFITHSHWDHIGGIDSILELNPTLTLFVPSSLPRNLINDIRSLSKEVIVCTKKPQKLFDNLYTTGLLGNKFPEQSLIIDDDYPKVISGCGHFGIDNITQKAKDIIQKDIRFALGGFHLMSSNEDEITKTIDNLKELGIQKVLPTHCTGDLAIDMFRDSFKENCLEGGAGSLIDINK